MIIKASQVNKTYTQGDAKIHALKDVSFELEKGKTLAIVGPSGSGKTTLLSVLCGLDSADSGEINIDGINLTGLNEKDLCDFRASKIGIIFQQFHLMSHLTALENVMVPLEIQGVKNPKEIAMEQLTQVGLEKRVHHLPHQLSGGERQRVAIARAFAVKPSLLFADEPSGNLDSETGDKVIGLLFDQVKKTSMTLVLVTHDKELAKQCDIQISVSGGSLK